MTSPPATGKRRSLINVASSEDQQLNIIAQEAESRLANSHAVLVEARQIKSTERERLRQAADEDDEMADDIPVQQMSPAMSPVSPPTTTPESLSVSVPVSSPMATPVSLPTATTASLPVTAPVSVTSKRSVTSDPVVNGAPVKSAAMTTMSPSSLFDKYKEVMKTNAQLDEDKQKLTYEVDFLKDRLSDLEEHNIQLEHLLAVTSRDLTEKKSLLSESEMKCKSLQASLLHTQSLIKEQSMLYVSVGDVVPADDSSEAGSETSALLPTELTQHLDTYDGSLGERLKNFFEEKLRFQSENKRLKHELELEKSRASLGSKFSQSSDSSMTSGNPGSAADSLDVESQKNITEYKWRLKRAEQEITTFQGNVTRLESQVTRYKSASEEAEKANEELKAEKRRLQRELRESQMQVQELETKNSHLMKRLEKSKYRNVNDSN